LQGLLVVNSYEHYHVDQQIYYRVGSAALAFVQLFDGGDEQVEAMESEVWTAAGNRPEVWAWQKKKTRGKSRKRKSHQR